MSVREDRIALTNRLAIEWFASRFPSMTIEAAAPTLLALNRQIAETYHANRTCAHMAQDAWTSEAVTATLPPWEE